ncbi:MAG: hypothetical protein J1E00_05405 [Oscillospiraceae bacterium]|nr:hypothetical protein [Oscillospiraceae bacterium]
MDENEKTIRKTYSLPSRIVTQEDGDAFVRTLTYTACEDGSCELLCVQGNGIQEHIVCNPNGIALSRTRRKADGTVSYRIECILDENGRIAQERRIAQEAHRIEHKYDTNGNETEQLCYTAYNGAEEKLLSRTVMTRDTEGRSLQHTKYDAYGDEYRILTWEYDERGRKTQYTEDDFMEMCSARYTYGETENGSRWECTTIYDGLGEIDRRYVEEYDPCDRLTVQTFYDSDGTVIRRSKVAEYCTVTLTDAQYKSFLAFCIEILNFYVVS